MLPGEPLALELCAELLRHQTYARPFARRLLAVACGRRKYSWELRRLAVLMLEHQALQLSADNMDEHDFLFVELNLKHERGGDQPLHDFVLTEGYSTIDLCAFTPQFRRRLGRLAHVHARLDGARTTVSALRTFLDAARHECKLALARYVFTADEVVARILRQVRATRGVRDLDPQQPRTVGLEAARAVAQMPAYEAAILTKLTAASHIYWVAEGVSSEINSLCEYPLTTVVVVVKPPGSDVEFEIKRAGRRGPHALGVAFRRENGAEVPQSHRLDGGSMQWLLRWEGKSAATLSHCYQLIHQTSPPPVARQISRTSIYELPGSDGGAHQVLDYFTEPHIFGTGFREMRAAMSEAVKSFNYEQELDPFTLDTDLGLTLKFLSHSTPAQAILSGTTSFRLDRLAAYLSPRGAKEYFNAGLRRDFDRDDARRFADEALEEILGVYQSPCAAYRSHGQYVAAAFRVAANRARADDNYLSALTQVGEFWGTVLALRGYSWGESFVARNVGLRSCWEAGEWRIKVVFMDHDNLQLIERKMTTYRPLDALPVMLVDERYVTGGPARRMFSTSETGYLGEIYQVDARLRRRGRTAFQRACKTAYHQTHDELLTNRELQRFFHPTFIERIRDWDSLAASHLRTDGTDESTKAWRRSARKLLRGKDYKKGDITAHLKAVEKYAAFIRRLAFLY